MSSLVHHADEEVETEEHQGSAVFSCFPFVCFTPSLQTHLKVSLVNAPGLFLPNQVVNQN